MSEQYSIELYHHPIGEELGYIHLVINHPEDPDLKRLILSSERGRDFGVIFTVDIFVDQYLEMCEEEQVTTLEGCVLATAGDQIEIREVPEDEPVQIPERIESQGNVRSLITDRMWTHDWGRCCCVKRGNEIEPVTPERIADGEVPWWNQRFTPMQLDLIAAATDPENKAMHLIAGDDTICGGCGHYVWIQLPEDVPNELPEPPEEEEVDEPLCPERDALDAVGWKNKAAAWEVFYDDPHNKKVIEESGLPIARANERRRFSSEDAFEPVNLRSDVKNNLHTVKQVFYFALGNTRSGTWAELDLDILRSIKGLKGVDIPNEVLEMVELDDEEANAAMHAQSENRATMAHVDDEADILESMLDEDAGLEVPPEFMEEDESEPEPEPEPEPNPEPEVFESKAQKLQSSPKPTSEPKAPKTRKFTRKQAKANLLEATKQLQNALAVFYQVLLDDEDEDEDEESQKVGG
jgi:hypothetical protein